MSVTLLACWLAVALTIVATWAVLVTLALWQDRADAARDATIIRYLERSLSATRTQERYWTHQAESLTWEATALYQETRRLTRDLGDATGAGR